MPGLFVFQFDFAGAAPVLRDQACHASDAISLGFVVGQDAVFFSAFFQVVGLMLKVFDFGGCGGVWRGHRDLRCREKTVQAMSRSTGVATYPCWTRFMIHGRARRQAR